MPIDATPVLPGFSEFVRDAAARPGNLDLSDAKYTAEKLLRDYPNVYEAIARALFYYRLPNRTIRDLFRVNGETVKAIRDHMIAAGATDGRAAFLIKSRTASQRDIVLCRLIDLLEERLSDGAHTASLTITELVALVDKLNGAKPASNGVDSNKPLKKNETYDLDEYDAVINGLIGEKKVARADDGGDETNGEESGAATRRPVDRGGTVECSTTSKFEEGDYCK